MMEKKEVGEEKKEKLLLINISFLILLIFPLDKNKYINK